MGPIAANAIIGRPTDRHGEHYPTFGAGERGDIAERVVSLVPAVRT